jgi:hypothetical protein
MPAQPRIKYKGSRTAHQVVLEGIRFDSRGEGERYLELCIAKARGEIRDFSLQPRFQIQPAFDKNGVHWRERVYRADFRVVQLDGHIVIEDVKGWHGFSTEIYKFKKCLVEFKFPHIRIEEVRRNGKNIDKLMEILKGMNHGKN